jgi:hypothetical protein
MYYGISPSDVVKLNFKINNMLLYEIVIGNYMDDKNYSKLVLSHEPLTVENSSNNTIINLNKDLEFIVEVKKPEILINAWDEMEFLELQNIAKIL